MTELLWNLTSRNKRELEFGILDVQNNLHASEICTKLHPHCVKSFNRKALAKIDNSKSETTRCPKVKSPQLFVFRIPACGTVNV